MYFGSGEAEAASRLGDLEATALALHDIVVADRSFVYEAADAVEAVCSRTPGGFHFARFAGKAMVVIGDELAQHGVGGWWLWTAWPLCGKLTPGPREESRATAVLEGKIMKLRIATITAATLFASAMTMAADGSWTGWISDSNCGAKGANATAGECTTKCVKEKGAKYVFVNDADQKVYVIDAQDKVAAHAGHHVTVKGSVDGDTLKLSSIDMAAEKGK